MRKSAPDQPDFGSFFKTRNPDPIAFEVRWDSNLYHDIAYLSSYMHDARFSLANVTRREKLLKIKLDRDRWELWHDEPGEELLTAASTLRLAPVLHWEWVFFDPQTVPRLDTDDELIVAEVFLGQGHWEGDDSTELVLSNRHAGWHLRVELAIEETVVRLEDDGPVEPS
jgi:hypothetical protein